MTVSKLILIYGCAYSACLPFLKIAILLDWNRIFFQHDKKTSVFWWGCAALSVLQAVWGVACIILLNMQCRPHEAIWKFYLESTCYDLPSVMLTSASVQVFTDITMVLLPQKVIWSLQMNWQRKVGVSIVFGVGLLSVIPLIIPPIIVYRWLNRHLRPFTSRACVAAIVRLHTTIDFAKTEDQMYYIGPLLFWACGEMTCGFFILCVPCLPKLISESGCSRRVKRALGASTGKPSVDGLNSSNLNSKFGSSYASRKKSRSTDILNTTVDASAYYQIDEEAVVLDDLKTSESTEQLRKSHHSGANGVHVTKTIVVTKSQSRSGPNDDEYSVATKLGTPWARPTKQDPNHF